MRELRVVGEQNNQTNSIQTLALKEPASIIPEPEFITQEQFDVGINSVVDKLADRLEPDSALTKEGKGFVKTVGDIHNITQALKSPTTVSMEEATSSLVTTVLGNALNNITGGGQQAAAPTPLKNTLAQIAVSNLTGENSPLPQLLDSLTNILGKDKVREGYDTGMRALENHQSQSSLPNIILQLDENSQEDVVDYAKQMGYTDVGYAQQKLIEHKNRLFQEIDEIQNVQQGGQQSVVEEPVQQEPIYEEPVLVEPVYQEPVQQKPYVGEQRILVDEEPAETVEKPVLKADKVVILHSEPRTLTVVSDKNNIVNNVINDNNVTNDNQDEYSNGNEISDIDNIISELGEQE